MRETGRIVEVDERVLGSELESQASSGATTLTLEDTTDFSEKGGQARLVDGSTEAIVTYTTLDDAAGTLTLSAALGATWPAETRVEVYPLTVERSAMLQLDDDPDEVLLASIPHTLQIPMQAGVREPDQQEAALVELRNDRWVLTDVLGKSIPSKVMEFVSTGDERPYAELVLVNSDDIALRFFHADPGHVAAALVACTAIGLELMSGLGSEINMLANKIELDAFIGEILLKAGTHLRIGDAVDAGNFAELRAALTSSGGGLPAAPSEVNSVRIYYRTDTSPNRLEAVNTAGTRVTLVSF